MPPAKMASSSLLISENVKGFAIDFPTLRKQGLMPCNISVGLPYGSCTDVVRIPIEDQLTCDSQED